jgi:hypothetical protein
MRKLIVKNFSVIKEAELEFGKITVLIGPQSSGKSLLCKLAFFFMQAVPEISIEALLLRMPFQKFIETVREEFVQRFPEVAWAGQVFEIAYQSDKLNLALRMSRSEGVLTLDFDKALAEKYGQGIASRLEEGIASSAVTSTREGAGILSGPIQPEGSIYIPAGRVFFSTPSKGYASYSGKNLDWITQRFSIEMDPDFRAMIGASTQKEELLRAFGEQAKGILRGRVVLFDGTPQFSLESDDSTLPFNLLSSGTLELLPLLNPLSKLASNAKFAKHWSEPDPPRGPIFVEEPESSVFPNTQYDLVRLFAWLSSEAALNLSFAITTHSPYILTAFNDLIKAGLVAAERPDKASAIEKVIPRQYWIKPDEFAAYAFDGKDGILRSIMDKDTKMINGDILDDISSDIADQFGQLLEIQYGGR